MRLFLWPRWTKSCWRNILNSCVFNTYRLHAMRLVRLFLWQRDKQSHAEWTSPQEDPLPFLCVQCGLLPGGFVTGILWLYCPWGSWLVLTVLSFEVLASNATSSRPFSSRSFPSLKKKKRLPQSCMQLKGGSQHASVGLNPWLRFWCRMSSGRLLSSLQRAGNCAVSQSLSVPGREPPHHPVEA